MELKNVFLIFVCILLLDSVNNIPRENFADISKEVSVTINDNRIRRLEEKENYITVLYRDKFWNADYEYSKGYGNEKRKGISFIELGDFKYNATEKFTIKEGSEIKIHFSKSITSLEYFFSDNYDKYVEHIESIDFSNFDLSLVTSFNKIFNGCNTLQSIKFSNNISSILDLRYMFAGCSSLKSIDLSDFDTSSLLHFEGMFFGCQSLKSINLSNFNTSAIEDIH